MDEFISKCIDLGTRVGGKIIFALIILIAGSLLIKWVKRLFSKTDRFLKLDKTVQNFVRSLITVILYAVLIISIVGILGIPMASIVAILASCGMAVGLALQGALGNLAGGLMLLMFRPFKVGDYIDAAGAEGTVKEITVFYTTIVTIDNKRITVPNGSLMNANVVNFSSEEMRRVDLQFKTTNDCDENLAKKVLLEAACATKGVKAEPAPFARLVGVDDDTLIFTVRTWCDNAAYWDVYFDLIENCSNALGENGIDDPEERIAVRMVKSED